MNEKTASPGFLAPGPKVKKTDRRVLAAILAVVTSLMVVLMFGLSSQKDAGSHGAGIPVVDHESKPLAPPVEGLGLDYLEKDTKAYIADVYDEVPIYPGIGIDMPAGTKDHIYRPCEPEYVYNGLLTVAKAGAKGAVLSRGFGEMQEKNMEAAGKAIDEINRLYNFNQE